jgi:hypothetical protein
MEIQVIERISGIGVGLTVVLMAGFLMGVVRLGGVGPVVGVCGQNSSSGEF